MSELTGYAAARTGVALYDQSHWGRISVSDEHRLDFLHNQSTNGFKLLKPGQACETTFLTSTARTLDLATALVLEDQVKLLVSPGMAEKLIAFLDRYIFFSDRVKLTNISSTTTTFCLIGPDFNNVLNALNIELSESGCIQIQCIDTIVQVVSGTGLAIPGCRLIVPIEASKQIWEALADRATVMNDQEYERLRIEQGRPMPGFELTDDYNPLEAGLWNTISFNKGCYIGQETIARLDTYNGVKLNLWGVKLDRAVELGSAVRVGEDKVGVITSVYELAQTMVSDRPEVIALAYVRTKAGGNGLQVAVDSQSTIQSTILTDLPFQVREKVTSSM